MGSVSDCYDNETMESFFSSLVAAAFVSERAPLKPMRVKTRGDESKIKIKPRAQT